MVLSTTFVQIIYTEKWPEILMLSLLTSPFVVSVKCYSQHHCLRKLSFKLEKLLRLAFVLYLSSSELFTPPVYKVEILNVFCLCQIYLQPCTLTGCRKVSRKWSICKDPGSQLWHTVWVRRPCKGCWSETTEMGSNSYINNSITSTHFLPENKDWNNVIFLWHVSMNSSTKKKLKCSW